MERTVVRRVVQSRISAALGGRGGGGESLVSVSVCRREPVWFLIGSPREETLLVIES